MLESEELDSAGEGVGHVVRGVSSFQVLTAS